MGRGSPCARVASGGMAGRTQTALVALVVGGGLFYWQSDRTSAADRTAAEACALYRSVAQASLSRSLDPARIDAP